MRSRATVCGNADRYDAAGRPRPTYSDAEVAVTVTSAVPSDTGVTVKRLSDNRHRRHFSMQSTANARSQAVCRCSVFVDGGEEEQLHAVAQGTIVAVSRPSDPDATARG